MNTNSNTYTFIYAIVMVVVVATILTLVAVGLQPAQRKNIELEKKKSILAALNIESTTDNVESLYDKHIVDLYAVNTKGEKIEGADAFNIILKDELKKPVSEQEWPVYVAVTKDGEPKFVLPLYGKGLWGPIWGYFALNDDMNTVFGVNFDHKSETPGLGSEINTKKFQEQFVGKQIFDENQKFVSIATLKVETSDNLHAVDAISGGTITSNGLSDMIETCLSAYLNFIEKNKK